MRQHRIMMFGGGEMRVFQTTILMLVTSIVFVGAHDSMLLLDDSPQVNFVHKCCALDERLSYKLRCMPVTETNINKDWLAGKLSRKLHSIMPVDAVATISRCDDSDIDLILLDGDESSISLLEDGSLHLSQEIKNVTLPVGSFCADRLPDDTVVLLTCPCTSVVCVQKCCHHPLILDISGDGPDATASCRMPPNDSMMWSQNFWKYQAADESDLCVGNEVDYQCYYEWSGGPTVFGGPEPPNNSKPVYEMHGYPECTVEAAQYIVDKQRNHVNAISDLHLTKDGGLQLANFGHFAPRTFCADVAVWSSSSSDSNSGSLNVIACRFRLSPTTRQNIYGVLYIIGTVSLILTVFVHLVFPQLRKTAQAYIMIAYCISLAFAYVSNSIIIFAGVKIQGTIFCRLLGLTIQGGFLAAFLWLNVMCIDIASTFRGLHLSKNNGKVHKGKKFVVYCLYVYGITATIIWLTIIAQHYSKRQAPISTNESCWFNDVTEATVFFFLPLGISQLINIILFICTALKIYKAQRQTAILSRDGSGRHTGKKPYSSQDKRRFLLFVKLFFLMGLTWTFEVISATFDEKNKMWYITDMINMLSGVIIFAMFCCKRKVFRLFLNTIKCSKKTETNSQKTSVSPKMSNSYSTRSTSIHVYNIDSAFRNEMSMTSSPNYRMSYL